MKFIKQFKDFLEDTVNLNETRFKRAEEGIETITTFLENDEVFGDIFIDTEPQGSFRQETIIKPQTIDHEFDVDLMFEVMEVEEWKPKDYLTNLASQFKKSSRYKDIVDTRSKNRCVTIDYASSDFHMDIVPVLIKADGYYVMNRSTNQFERTDGDGYAEWFSGRNKITGSKHLTKVVRLIKYIRDSQNAFEAKSILLTTLLGNQVKDTDTQAINYPDLPTSFVTIISRLDDYLQSNPFMPTVLNPKLTSENFNRKWDQVRYRVFREKIHEIRKSAEDALFENSETLSLGKWQKIFGDKFGASQPLSKYVASVEDFVDEYSPEEEYLDVNRGIPYKPQPYEFKIDVFINQDGGFRETVISKIWILLKKHSPTYRVVKSTIPEPYEVLWKIKNSGKEAKSSYKLRGEIHNSTGKRERKGEIASYSGVHRVEGYAIKDGVCIAKDVMYIRIPD